MGKNKEYWVEHRGLFVSSEGRIMKVGRSSFRDGGIVYVGREAILRSTFIAGAMLGKPKGKYCKLIYLDGDEGNLSESNLMYKVSYKAYREMVESLTSKLPLYLLKDIEKRGFRRWDLDHIIPSKYGWENNLHPRDIARMDNLQMLPHSENFEKGLVPYCVISQCDHLYLSEDKLKEVRSQSKKKRGYYNKK